MHYIMVGISSIVGGLGIGSLTAWILEKTGDFGDIAVAGGLALPIGSVLGIGLYKKIFLHVKFDIAGGILGCITCFLGVLAAIYAIHHWPKFLGHNGVEIFIPMIFACLCSLPGYSIGSKITKLSRGGTAGSR